MQAVSRSVRKHRLHVSELVAFIVLALVLVGIDLMFYFWPFRYREVHPLLEKTFASTVVVRRFHRTYFPHPGFVAEGVTFYRHGNTEGPPLATIQRMRVVGTWSSLLFHPHTLYQIWLEGMHVQIPGNGTQPGPGTHRRSRVLRPSGDEKMPSTASRLKMHIETVVADASTVDFLNPGKPPQRFVFSTLQVHDIRANHPFTFFARLGLPVLQGMLVANGSVGPLDQKDYGATPLEGTYSLLRGDLSRLPDLAGHVAASGTYQGKISDVVVAGKASVPDFRVTDAHTLRLDAAYRVKVNGTNWGIGIENAQVRCGRSTITASGSIGGSPKQVVVNFSTKDGQLQELLDMIEKNTPSVTGEVSFQASAHFRGGPEPFLKRLNLQGQISVADVTFVKANTQHDMDAFSAREQKHSGDDPAHPNVVKAAASSQTTFHNGMAYFPDIQVELPGAKGHLHGTFNLLNTDVHLTGKAALERSLSHAVTGWKAWLVKPLAPFFRKKDAGAVVSIAVTGTAANPKISQDIFHDK